MADYEQSTVLTVPTKALYDYLADPDNLPQYIPNITAAHTVGDGDAVDVTAQISPEGEPERTVHGEAWLRVKHEGSALEWGAQGPHDYHGSLEVEDLGDEGTRLTVKLSTERVESDQIDDSLRDTLTHIGTLVGG